MLANTIGSGNFLPNTLVDKSNWVGIQNWLTSKSFTWSGAPYFRSLSNRPWFVNETKVGMTRKYEGLTWVTVAEAGHMVPYNRPVESLEMLRRWLSGKEM